MQITKSAKFAIGFSRINRWGNIQKYLKGYKRHLDEFMSLDGKRKCILIGSATYDNIGDLAISEAELAFLREYFNGSVIQIPTMGFVEYERLLRAYLTKDDVLCFQGGGNMGDLYPGFEFERCEALEYFPHLKSVIMPQTMHYLDAESPWLRYSQKVYRHCTDLHLFARERNSERLMKEAYPTTSVSLVPDIVLSLDTKSYVSTTNGKREGMALVLRQDAERNLTMEDWAMIHDVVSQSGMKVTQMDTMADAKYIALEDRHDVVAELLSRFASSKVVVTDRLHGMIFAAITGTPCVAFANSNRKVGGVYQWINDLPYIQYINDTRQLEESLQAVLSADTAYPRMRIMKEFHSLIAALH